MPETQDLLEQLVALIKQQATPTPPIVPVKLPEFHGTDSEDPQVFLKNCERVFATNQIPEEEWISTAKGQLRGTADIWWTKVSFRSANYVDFKESLVEEFDNDELIGRLRAKLYSEKQGSETVRAFLREKQALASRIRKNVTDNELIRTCRPLLRREILTSLVAIKFATMDEFISIASTVERNLPPTKKTIPRVDDRPPPTTSRLRDRPPKCWYCPNFHFNADCPKRQAGNARGSLPRFEPKAEEVWPQK